MRCESSDLDGGNVLCGDGTKIFWDLDPVKAGLK